MKSKSNELLDKSISAMIAAIEVYNKPDFLYRGETFSILAINSWELLLKAKYLKDNHNKMRSLYKSTGSTFSAITVDTVKKILLPIPPITEQLRITQKILDFNSNIESIKASLR